EVFRGETSRVAVDHFWSRSRFVRSVNVVLVDRRAPGTGSAHFCFCSAVRSTQPGVDRTTGTSRARASRKDNSMSTTRHRMTSGVLLLFVSSVAVVLAKDRIFV